MIPGIIAGLLLGSGVNGHALRLVTLAGDPDAKGRRFVATAACLIYGGAAISVIAGSPVGYVVAIVGPVVGVTSVLALRAKVDRFQVVLGFGQVAAGLLSAWELARLL